MRNLRVKRAPLPISIAFVWALAGTLIPSFVHAQVAPKAVNTRIVETTRAGLDLATRTTQTIEPTTNVTTTSITGGTRPNGGPNLFHSFDFFTVGSKDIAHFQNDMMLPTTNIIARVIGDGLGIREASTIDGILRTNSNPFNPADPLNFGAANLYFINPQGVMLKENAQLNVGGSANFATADNLRFNNVATLFDAAATPASLGPLHIASVAAFGFTNPRPVAISIERSVDGFLGGADIAIAAGRTFSLVGGDIAIRAEPILGQNGIPTISAPGGVVQLASLSAPGEVPANVIDLNVNGAGNFGEVSLTQGAIVDVAGNGGGTVAIRGGRLVVDQAGVFADNFGNTHSGQSAIDFQLRDEAIITNGSVVAADVFRAGNSGDFLLSANRVAVSANSNLGTHAFRGSTGNTGSVEIRGEDITIMGGSQIETRTFSGSTGHGGRVTVQAGNVTVESNSRIRSTTSGLGNGGGVKVGARTVRVTEGGSISGTTFGAGRGGEVEITAEEAITVHDASISADARGTSPNAGAAGNIMALAKNVALTDGGQIGSSSFGPGAGGNTKVTATEGLTAVGTSQDGVFLSGLFGTAEGTGPAGDIVVEARDVVLADGATFLNDTFGTGRGGTVHVIAAESVTISGTTADGQSRSALSSSSRGVMHGAGDAGSIIVDAKNVIVADKGSITSETRGAGKGGSLQVSATNDVLLTGGAGISSATDGAGAGGSIRVTAGETVRVVGVTADGQLVTFISANTNGIASGSGNAGSITIQAKNVTVADGATITSSTLGAGLGGNIQMTAGQLIQVLGVTADGKTPSVVRASTESTAPNAGDAGSIVLQAKNISVTDGAIVQSLSGGPGLGGTIHVMATETMFVGGPPAGGLLPSALGANAQGKNLDAGDAGTVLVEARNVTIANGGQLSSSTSGPGRGGTIQITAQETVSLTGENPDGQIPSGLFASSLSREQDAGPAGQIEVTAAEFSLTQGGSIFSRTAGPGAGGTVDATISGGLTLSGQRTKILTDTEGTGAGGSIQLSAAQINLKDQARLSSASSGLGNAGDILLTARQSFESDQSTVQTSADLGVGGDIHIIAGESARLVNNSLVSATSAGQGDAGSVTIDGGTLIRGIDSTITGEAQQASGGNVTLIADDLIHLTRTNVTASVQGGPQSIGGNILFDPQIILLQNSKVVAQANQGAGGTITLVAGTVLADPSSLISASSQSGPQGTVTIQSPLQNLSGALVPLQQGFLPVTTLHAERCAARMSEGKVSTFVVTLREGLPPEPGGPLPSPLEDIDLAAAELPESLRLLASSADPVSPATGRDLNRTGSFNHACRR